MIDTYYILNKKCNFFIYIFILNVIILIMYIIYGMNTYTYQNYIQLHSEIIIKNSLFYLEVLIPEKEVSNITTNEKIIIEKKEYQYKVIEQDNKITYLNNINYQKCYLEIINLEKSYQKEGYHLLIKIPQKKKKIMEYFKE